MPRSQTDDERKRVSEWVTHLYMFHEWYHSLVSKPNRPSIDHHSILLTEWQGAAVLFVKPFKSVYCGKMIGWMQTLFYLGQEASADLGYVSNATTSRCFAVTIRQNQNRTGKNRTEQATTKQTNKQPMGHQDSTREFGNDVARRNPIWGNLQTLALPRGVQCVSKRREERQIWCQLTISLENDKL